MNDIRDTIEALLDMQGRFKMRQVLRQVPKTRQAVWRQLKRMVDCGELIKRGSGPGVHYVRGHAGGAAKTPDRRSFWTALMERAPHCGYVDLYAMFGSKLRFGHQARRALEGVTHDRQLLILDFAGVEEVSEAFLSGILTEWRQGTLAEVQPINASPEVAARIRHMLRIREARTGESYVPWRSDTTARN